MVAKNKYNKYLTIVIPTYNAEAFMDKNLASFLDKRLMDKGEILIINDGSLDRSGEKAREYERKYPGYIRLIEKENGGHGSGINVGIREAKGKYFKVIDADDWVHTDNLVKLLLECQSRDADLLINPYIKVDESSGFEKICGNYSKFPQNVLLPFRKLAASDISLVLHSVTYKTCLLKDNNIRLTEKCFYEDFQYVLYPMPYIKTALLFDFPVYYYLVGQEEQSVNAEKALKNVEMYVKVYADSIKYLEKVSGELDRNSMEYMNRCMCRYLLSLYNIFIRNGKHPYSYEKLQRVDKKVRQVSEYFYSRVGKENVYISVMRKGNKRMLYLLCVIFNLRNTKK